MILDEDYVRPADLAAQLGARVAINAADTEAELRRERLKKSRHVDLVVAAELRSLGWTQVDQLTGLSWCVVCGGPTIWLDASGSPRHHSCLEG
jgi:hypothetical protein